MGVLLATLSMLLAGVGSIFFAAAGLAVAAVILYML